MYTTAYKQTILFSSTKQKSYYYNIQTDLKNKETGSNIALAVGGRIKLTASCQLLGLPFLQTKSWESLSIALWSL